MLDELVLGIAFTYFVVSIFRLAFRWVQKRYGHLRLFQRRVEISYWGVYDTAPSHAFTGTIALPKASAADVTTCSGNAGYKVGK